MSILDRLKRLMRSNGEDARGEADRFIDPEPLPVSHPDPRISAMLAEQSATRREINWISWKVYRLQKKGGLSEFETRQLKRLNRDFERLVKVYSRQEAVLREMLSSRGRDREHVR